MKKLLFLCVATLIVGCSSPHKDQEKNHAKEKFTQPNFGIVLHGGAGTILKEHMSDSLESEYTMVLNKAITIGHTILANGGTSLEAVTKTINILEDSPLFN